MKVFTPINVHSMHLQPENGIRRVIYYILIKSIRHIHLTAVVCCCNAQDIPLLLRVLIIVLMNLIS